MKQYILACTILVLAFGGLSAQAQNITFETGDPVDMGTFVISSPGPNGISDFGTFPTTVFGWCAEDCSGLQVVTLNRADNAPFSISALDIAAFSDVGNGNPIIVTGNLDGGGTVMQNLALPLVADTLETRTLTGFNNVVSVTFSKRDTYAPDLADAAIDNIVLGAAAAPVEASPVPAMPLSVLLLTALGAIFLGRRKLRSKA